MRARMLVFALALLGAAAQARALDLTTIATDPFTQATCTANGVTNHQSLVEPDSFASGSTIVAAFQSGRIQNSGACTIGFATSTDNGASWTSGLLPGITRNAGGSYDRASDPVVAYDARHGAWLVASLAIEEVSGGTRGAALLVNRSTDGGLTWGPPVIADATSLDADKNWIVCDNSAASPYYGNCYMQWDDHGAGNKLYMSTSRDGGLTWGPPLSNGATGIGGQPVVRRDGTVVVPVANANITALGVFRSGNGGASWTAVQRITGIRHHQVAGGLREVAMPSAEIDGAGSVYVAWSDCRFRRSCASNDIVFVRSRNATATRWTAVKRVPIDPATSGIDHFIPGLAVNAADTSNVRIGLTYYFYKANSTVLNIGYISSRSGGSSWSLPLEVTGPATAFPPGWTATTTLGRMVGDYVSTSFSADQQAHAIVSIAAAPSSGELTSCTTTALDNCRQAIATFTAGTGSAALLASGGPVLAAPPGDASSARSAPPLAISR